MMATKEKDKDQTQPSATSVPSTPLVAEDAPAQQTQDAALRQREEDLNRREQALREGEAALAREKAALAHEANMLNLEHKVSDQPKRVEVLADNLGPNLLRKGQITDDPQIVALLETPRGRTLVREVS